MTIANVTSIAEGVGYGLNLAEMKRLGDSMYQGRNIWSGTMFQTAQIGSVMELAETALGAGGCAALPWPLRTVLCLTPALLALATRFLGQSETQEESSVALWRQVAIFIQDQISNLCQVAAIVASVAMIYFGSVFFGAASLAMLGVGVLDYYAIFPECVSQLLHEYSPPILFLTALLTGNAANIFFSSVNIFAFCWRLYDEYVETHREVDVPKANAAVVEEYLKEEFPLEVNPKYFYWRISGPAVAIDAMIKKNPNAIAKMDFQLLIELFKKINKDEKNIKALRTKFRNDHSFRDRFGGLAVNQKLFETGEEQLIECVKRVQKGYPTVRDNNRLRKYMQFITYEIQRKCLQRDSIVIVESKPEEQTTREEKERLKSKQAIQAEIDDILMRLAVEAGKHCGPGVFAVAQDICRGLIGSSEEFTPQDKVLHELQTLREFTVEGMQAEVFAMQQTKAEQQNSWGVMSLIGAITQADDTHFVHVFQNLVGRQFGLGNGAAANDGLAIADPLMKLLISCAFGSQIEQVFQEQHNPAVLADTIQSRISKGELWQLWGDAIQLEPLSYNKPLDQEAKMSIPYVKALLLGMGVLQRTSPKNRINA